VSLAVTCWINGPVFAKFRSTNYKNRNPKSFGMLRRVDWCRRHKIQANQSIQQHSHSTYRTQRTTTRLPPDVYGFMVIVLLTVGPRKKSTFITPTFKPFLRWPQQTLDKCAHKLRHVCLSGCKTYAEVIFSLNWKYIAISIKIGQKWRTIMYKFACVSVRIKVEIRVLPSA
jgi:hypothetical protein